MRSPSDSPTPGVSDRIDILVIAPDTDPAVAERALLFASEAGNPERAEEILARARRPISQQASA